MLLIWQFIYSFNVMNSLSLAKCPWSPGKLRGMAWKDKRRRQAWLTVNEIMVSLDTSWGSHRVHFRLFSNALCYITLHTNNYVDELLLEMRGCSPYFYAHIHVRHVFAGALHAKANCRISLRSVFVSPHETNYFLTDIKLLGHLIYTKTHYWVIRKLLRD